MLKAVRDVLVWDQVSKQKIPASGFTEYWYVFIGLGQGQWARIGLNVWAQIVEVNCFDLVFLNCCLGDGRARVSFVC